MRENRIIKFRAWDGRYNKMHYKVCVGNLHDEGNYTAHSVYLQPGDTDYKINPPGHWMSFDEHSDYTLMQFTGLLDKNKNEIYDGDVIRSFYSDGSPCRHLIEYDVNSASFVGRYIDYIDNITDTSFTSLSQKWILESDKEIIGNTYSNPELINK